MEMKPEKERKGESVYAQYEGEQEFESILISVDLMCERLGIFHFRQDALIVGFATVKCR